MSALLSKLHSRDSESLILQDASRHFDTRQLEQAIAHFTHTLNKLGIDRLALFADNSIDWLIADLACLKLDTVLLPLPAYFSSAQLQHALLTSGIRHIATDNPQQLQTLLPKLKLQIQHEYSPGLCILESGIDIDRPELPRSTQKITFTSGSSGQPKGVCLSAEQQELQASAICEAIQIEQPMHMCALPLPTLLENIAGVYAPLFAGGQVHLPSLHALGFEGSRLLRPQAFLQQLSLIKPDTLILIPQLLAFLVQAASQGWPVPEFKFVAVGGSKVSPDLIHEARRVGIPAYEGYGLSECTSVVSLNTPAADQPGSCGKVLPVHQLSIENGEILIRGNNMLGYLENPETWYSDRIHTGDLGHLDTNNFLHIDGRCKNLLISSYGRNISPEWVESELLTSPLFSEAVVFGDARPHCVALLSARSAEISDGQINQAMEGINSKLPDYARVQAWHRLSEPLAGNPLFMTSNGRPRREQICQHYADIIEQLYLNNDISPTESTREEHTAA
jgi:long-chain acyl-CoA synthetase